MIPICKQILSLKKLKLDFGLIELSEDLCHELCIMIQSLKNLRELELPSFSISTSKILSVAIQNIVEMGVLEKFHIGEIEKSIPENKLMENLIKLMSLRGLKDFILSKHIKISEKKLERIMPLIQRENPEIQFDQVFYRLTGDIAYSTITYWKYL